MYPRCNKLYNNCYVRFACHRVKCVFMFTISEFYSIKSTEAIKKTYLKSVLINIMKVLRVL